MNSTSASSQTAPAHPWALPLFVTQANKYQTGLILAALATLLYLASNHYHLYPPQFLTMSWIDEAIPFLPYTVWIYMSEWIFFVCVYFTCKNMLNLNKYCYSFLALQLVSVLIFWLWPTTYPRDLFPLSNQLEPLTLWAFQTLRSTDTPANCCPSLHVSSVYLSAFIFLDEQKGKFPFFFIWGTAIAISTLTTKQHYLIDVISGLLFAFACYFIFHRFVRYRPFRADDQPR